MPSTDTREQFETWLRSTCFQAPPEQGYDLAWSAWQAALRSPAGRDDGETIQGVVFILLDDEERVLMERCPKKAVRHGGEWFIPGGRIELGETPEQAMTRELSEELGVEARLVDELPLVDATGGDNGGSFLMRIFFVEDWLGEIPTHVLDHPDVPLRWVPLEEARRSPVAAVRAILAHIPLASPAPSAPEEEP